MSNRNDIIPSPITYHNKNQLEYFDRKIKSTMVPVDTYYVNRHVDYLIEFSKIQREDKILEVGCGMGKFTFPLLKRGFKVFGLDLSPFLLQQLLKHNDGKFDIPLIAGDILDISEDFDEEFDVVLGFFTLHHFHHLSTYYQAMCRILKPGGKIIFIEPNAYNLLYYLQIFFTPGMSWTGDKGVANMRVSKVKKAIQSASLENLRVKKYGMFPPFITNTSMGRRLELFIQKMKMFEPISAFQIFEVRKPNIG